MQASCAGRNREMEEVTCERAAAEILVGVGGAEGCCSPGVAGSGSGGSPSRAQSVVLAACI